MKNLIIYKPNQMIEIVGNPISSQGLLAYNFLLHKFQEKKIDNILISADEIFKNINILNNHDELYSYLDSLQKIRIESRDTKGRLWGAFNLLSEFKKVDNGIFIAIPPTIFKALCGSEKEKELYYTTINLLEQKAFKCSYSLIFYELFKKYEKINIPIYTLEELKEITGTTNKYNIYYEFKRYVINKALKEINKFNAKYQYSFEEIKLGRKVNEIKFIRTEKNIEKNIIDVKFKGSEKLLKSIEKARQNRFVDECFSKKAMNKIIAKYNEKDIIKALGELYKYNFEIKSFSKILTAKIEDIKESYTNIPPKLKTSVKQANIKPKITEFEALQEKICSLAKNYLDMTKWIGFCGKIGQCKNEVEIDQICDDFKLNLKK